MNKPNDAEVIVVGDELLKGERTDAHLAHIGRALLPCGARVGRAYVIGDDTAALAGLVREGCRRSRVLIVTGGLGPTKDDVTRDGVAEGLGLALEWHQPTWDRIVEIFAELGAEATENNRQQAMFPSAARVIENARGTAPGFEVDAGDATVFVLPGPPRELVPMLEDAVVPRVREIFGRDPVRVETFRTIGVGESALVTRFSEVFDAIDAYTVSFLASAVSVDIVLTQRRGAQPDALDAECRHLSQLLRDNLGTKCYERGRRSLGRVVHDRLIERGETLGVAESLTGGMIADMLVEHAGSSAYLMADAVTYSDASKQEFVGVRAETLAAHGAVSEETCTEMAHGIRNRTGATWGIATTGIAGPGGATPTKPVGLTFIGLAWDGGTRVKRLKYRGERAVVRRRASFGALWLLFDRLQGE